MTDGLHFVTAPTGLDGDLDAAGWAARPDAHLVDVERGEVRAHASLWWTSTHEAGVGYVGHAVWDDAEGGRRLLEAALDRLREAGCASALGPIDGSTWHSYRVVTERAPGGVERAPFASEPVPAPAIGEAFERAGFAPAARYVSALVETLPDRSEAWASTQRALAERGVRLRPFDASAGELRRLIPLALEAFADSRFYTPLDAGEVEALYAPLVAQNDPRLMWIAERDGAPVGFHLGFPDLAQAARGEAVDTLVCKTLAVAPDVRGQGLGGALTLALEEAGRQLGLARAIHALMHVENDSLKISQRAARPMRRYALLGRAL